jgi:hypothetical protein
MLSRRAAASRSVAVRVLVALAAVSACCGAVVAYAATRPEARDTGLAAKRTVKVSTGSGSGAGAAGPKSEERLLRPRFLESPQAVTTLTESQFRFHVAPRPQRLTSTPPGPPGEPPPLRRFQCRIDGGDWIACSSPHRLAGLAPGDHSFAVRAFTRDGRSGPAAAHAWRQLERSPERAPGPLNPMPFSIESQATDFEDLYPGHPAQQLPVLISNPNPVAIEVTSLAVAIAGDPADCPPDNFALTPSSVSPAVPLVVPADGSVSLPSATASAPAIGMLDLPVNQDACRGVEVPLVFSGEARG